MLLPELQKKLREYADNQKAKILKRFFRTGPGQYAAGDKFLGITVPKIRKLVREYGKYLTKDEITRLLHSAIHEERLLALLILSARYKEGAYKEKKSIYQLYLKNTKYINNWDLVDLSAAHIIGDFLYRKDKNPLYRLARSKNLWERRISIIATFYFIKKSNFNDTLNIARILRLDKEDLIHKATGWMLREVGKRNQKVEEAFLKKYYKKMPRTMLRYAIERFPESRRQAYLQGKI
jgi:3-methyladenine DNA glycosylase AlkD